MTASLMIWMSTYRLHAYVRLFRRAICDIPDILQGLKTFLKLSRFVCMFSDNALRCVYSTFVYISTPRVDLKWSANNQNAMYIYVFPPPTADVIGPNDTAYNA